MLKRRSWLGLALAVPFAAGRRPGAGAGGVVVFAAASLKNALDEIAATWAKDTGKPAPRISYAASSALAKQMEQGAPADLFISADLDWMDYVGEQEPDQGRHPLQPAGQQDRADRAQGLQDHDARHQPGVDLAKALAGGKLSMGNVDAVPAGKYGKAALEKLGAWSSVEGQHRPGRERARRARCWWRAARRRSASSTAPTPRPSPSVKIVATFPADRHPPIIYPAALTTRVEERRRQGLPRLPAQRQGARRRSRSRASRVLVKSASST